MPIDDTEHLLSSEKNAGRLRKSMAAFRTRSSISGRFKPEPRGIFAWVIRLFRVKEAR